MAAVALPAGLACDGPILDGGTTLAAVWDASPKTAEGWPAGSCTEAGTCAVGPLVHFSSTVEAAVAVVGRYEACLPPQPLPVPGYTGEEFGADGTHYDLVGPDFQRDPDPDHQLPWSIIALSAQPGSPAQTLFKVTIGDSPDVDWSSLSNCPRVISSPAKTLSGLTEYP
jgi:hypothetical protein